MNNNLNDFCNDLLDVVDKYRDSLPSYEIGHRLIATGVEILICTAPNPFLAFRTALKSFEVGIAEYEGNHSK